MQAGMRLEDSLSAHNERRRSPTDARAAQPEPFPFSTRAPTTRGIGRNIASALLWSLELVSGMNIEGS